MKYIEFATEIKTPVYLVYFQTLLWPQKRMDKKTFKAQERMRKTDSAFSNAVYRRDIY